MKQSWIDHFLGMARYVSTKSRDPSTKVGCVIVAPDMSVRSTGFNGFPRGCNDSQGLYENREIKLARVAHAEGNAIAQAAKSGATIDGCIAVVSLHPCSQCAALLINAGIRTVVCPMFDTESKWKDSFEMAQLMFAESGVKVIYE